MYIATVSILKAQRNTLQIILTQGVYVTNVG